MNKLFRNDLDNKMFRDLVLSFTVCFTYVTYTSLVAGMTNGIIISLAAAGFFTLMSEIVRNLVEEDLAIKKSLSKEEANRKYQMRLVLRDSIVAFVLSYGYMTGSFVAGASLASAIPYAVAALAPTLVVAVFSKEMRAPFLREYREHDAVTREFELRRVA
ncbi:MAG: hypothetical protein ACI3VR_13650 [Intestinibacter sp.]|uniref:hypothetical protein n=1 Tax=Intestinibacter sp. TaxID=1965304 RepID=UPI003F17B31B